MPAEVTLGMVLSVLVPVGIVTVVLRILPFEFVRRLRDNRFIDQLGMMMPVGVMTVLVVYTIDGQREAPGGLLAAFIGVAITLGLHLWRRDAGLSIFGGTLAYMVLVNLVF